MAGLTPGPGSARIPRTENALDDALELLFDKRVRSGRFRFRPDARSTGLAPMARADAVPETAASAHPVSGVGFGAAHGSRDGACEIGRCFDMRQVTLPWQSNQIRLR